jgi:hypothetical protein
MRRYVWLFGLVLLLLLPPGNAVSGRAQTAERCFAETGHCISGRVREFWEQQGGLPVFGLPITPLQTEQVERNSYQVQWFERARFELHPENAPPYNVLLGLLGRELYRVVSAP